MIPIPIPRWRDFNPAGRALRIEWAKLMMAVSGFEMPNGSVQPLVLIKLAISVIVSLCCVARAPYGAHRRRLWK